MTEILRTPRVTSLAPQFLVDDLQLGGDSTRPELLEDFLGINQATGGDIDGGFTEGLVERGTIRFVEPVTGVEWQKLEFGTLGQIRRLVDDQPARTDTCLDGHGNESSTGRARQALAAVGA